MHKTQNYFNVQAQFMQLLLEWRMLLFLLVNSKGYTDVLY